MAESARKPSSEAPVPCGAGTGARVLLAPQDSTDDVLRVFYRTVRAGQERLAGGGGPFGFDVTVALLVDDLIDAYRCDAVVETGCHLGDTASYLGRRYPGLPVMTCDIDPGYARFTAHRVRDLPNVTVTCQDSPALVADAADAFDRPLYFLDAHWGAWPLPRELAAIRAGVVLIDDFDIGHPRFGHDAYDGVPCGPDVLAAMTPPPARYWTPVPGAERRLPCLQVGRRAGVGLLVAGLDGRPLDEHPALTGHTLTTEEIR